MSLIKCHRHTKEDLKLWEAYERSDLVYYEMNQTRIQEKIEKAIESIREFSKEPCYCGVSWGKDSLVVSHLVYLSGCDIPLVHISIEKLSNPYCKDVRDLYLKITNQKYYEIEINVSKNVKTGRLETGFKQAKDLYGHYISGVRKEESITRKMSAKKHGVMTVNACRPILDWTHKEVFAYLSHNDLPIHPTYSMFMNGKLDRQFLRVGSIGGERGREFGRLEFETFYYPDLLRRIEKTG